MNKAEWIAKGNNRERALQQIATHLGKGHTVTKMLGPLAWGRHNWETGPNRTLENSIVLAAALDGVFHTINMWARDNDTVAQRSIIDIYRRSENGGTL